MSPRLIPPACSITPNSITQSSINTGEGPPPGHTTLHTLTSAALLLPSLLLSSTPTHAQYARSSSDSVSFQYSRFEEGKRNLVNAPNNLDPIRVDVLHGSGSFTLTDRLKFSFGYTQDTWSGATPVTTAPLVTNGNRLILENAPGGGVTTVGASPFINTSILLDRNLNPLRSDTATGQQVIDNRSVEILSTASPETRNQADFSLGYEWNEAIVNIGGGFSLEPDFKSSYGNLNGQLDFNQKLTTLKWGVGFTHSDIAAILDHDILPYLTRSVFDSQIERRGGSEILHGTKKDWTFNLGLTQVLNKGALVDANFGFTHSRGFMENPYKAMTVIFIDPETVSPDPNAPLSGVVRALSEQRPDFRNQVAFNSKYVQHISPFNAALHLNYKFSYDDWGVLANSFEADWVQPLGKGWTLTPRIRYYSQSAADFYQPFLFSDQAFSRISVDPAGRQIWVDTNNPNTEFFRDRNANFFDAQGNTVDQALLNIQPKFTSFDQEKLPGNFSSDHRLSSYGTLSGGITINKKFARGFELEGGFEYYTRASVLKLGGRGNSSFADFDFYVWNAALKIYPDKLNFSSSTGQQHDTSHNQSFQHDGHSFHGGHTAAPAGVMYAHMLDKPGDIMVGYRFMYSRQAGDMLHGDRSASDAEIVNQSCSAAIPCRFTPTDMNMKMHMLDIMYAPTSWLNLMVMPQFMDMDMNIRELDGRPPRISGVHEHTGIQGHATGGVGDTIISSLFKLYEAPNHHLHMGLGLSAPTGRVNLDFRRVFQIDGGRVHFDMQLGSGTWDFLPNLTYKGDYKRWSWGAQLSGIKRMERSNTSGYRLGDRFQATTWGGYHLANWLSASVRGIYTAQGAIKGDFNSFNRRVGPMDFSGNSGGQFWDIGLGVNVIVPRGKFAGNSFGFEWLQPLHDDVNGFQLERKGALSATWSYHF
ncbi:DUF3570 domain-containing protein [Nitrosomonas mobilis]|uniref:Uncharacterized protein n=1 Tax=Nitrosomonas mobilis TaxID=51642 RepID=A0A1G5SKS5_9PROT|nr:DUF3570 domain-containing protein [Nitrosomonas mobilis]SCZ86969.1 conserved hypothetical protein [Nitrosomonas mobilis]